MKTETDKECVSSFSAMVMFLDDGEEKTYDVELDKPVEDLTYDEVEDAIHEAIDDDNGYTLEDFADDSNLPYEILDIVVNDNDGSWPVIPEDADIEKLKKTLDVEKFLVLPWARYALTPECKLWMEMKKNGIVDADAPFDYDKMHKLVETVSGK